MLAQRSPVADAPPIAPLAGLTLEQYAGITVALAEGFPLPAILANEGLSPPAWPPADLAWKARLAKDGAAGPVFTQFCAKRVIAEDWLTRRVAPIDVNLATWLTFLRAWSRHPTPFKLLSVAGLGMNDIARLQRLWARRMADDDAVKQQAKKLVTEGLGPLPAIHAHAGRLKPFPWSKGPGPDAAPPAPSLALPADTSMAPGALRLYSYVVVMAQLAEHPGHEKDVLAKMGLAEFASVDAGWQAILRSNPALERDYRRLLDHERARLRSVAKQPASEPVVAPPPPAAPLAGTSLALDVPRGPALPFAASARLPQELAGTSLEVKVPCGAALPFAKNAWIALPAARAVAPAADAAPAAARNALAATSRALDIPRGPSLPFADRQQIPARSPLPADATPPLSLEQHASLCCELAGAPDRAAETLARYRITPAQKQVADQHFNERFAREPGAREAWDSAYRTYRDWWLESGAGRVSR